MEKTFKEVIRDIKIGEVWEDGTFILYLENDYLQIDFKTGTDTVPGIEMKLDDIFTLRKQKVDFITAFKAYEEGKEIESCVSKKKFYLGYYNNEYFTYEEIKGKWYICGEDN